MKKRLSGWIIASSLLSIASVIHADAPVTPSLVGATPGAFQVLPSGAASYQISIEIPPGAAGTQPQLGLSHNSQGGNGLLGIGWSLGGLSVIHRCPQTLAQDGRVHGVDFTSGDRFCLDGKRLLNVKGVYGADGSEYHTEIDGFTKVIAHGNQADGPAWFEAWTKSGEVMQYGLSNDHENDNDSRIEAKDKNVVAVWALNRVTDTAGNNLTIEYIHNTVTGEYRPRVIRYTYKAGTSLQPFASIVFNYEPRPDPIVGYRAGSRTVISTRLKQIVVNHQTATVRKYNLYYRDTSESQPYSLLNAIQTCDGNDQCGRATTLTWQLAGNGSLAMSDHSQVRGGHGGDYQQHTGDFNGDGLTDAALVHWSQDYGWQIITSLGKGDGTLKTSVLSQVRAGHGGDYQQHSGDFDGDGLTDFEYGERAVPR